MRFLLAGVVAAAAAAGAGLLLLLPSEREFRGSTPPVRLELPAFSLRDQEGRVVSDADLRGKVVLVTFLDTKCTDACPIVAEQIREGLARVDDEDAVAVAISVHPGDDTPAAVRAFLRRHRVERDLLYLVGSEAELRPVWDAFQVLPALDSGSSSVHSAPVRIFDRDGVWVSTLHVGADLTPANLAHDVETAG